MKADNQSPHPMVYTVIYDPDEQAFQLAFSSGSDAKPKRNGCVIGRAELQLDLVDTLPEWNSEFRK